MIAPTDWRQDASAHTAAHLAADTADVSATSPAPLRLQRRLATSATGAAADLANESSHGDGPLLGGLYLGHAGPGTPGGLFDIGAPRLLADGPALEAWWTRGPVLAGRHGDVHWRRDGPWCFGAIDLRQQPDEGLEACTRRAYSQLFAMLREAGLPHLQRVWNYVPEINAEVGGLERYRQFNAGRQQAFIDDGRDVMAGAPAACALGVRAPAGDVEGGVLRIRLLAGARPTVPIENPRQVPAYRYPPDYGVRRPSFSRAALADVGSGQVALLISGTASIVEHRSLHVGDVQAQTRETLLNLQAVIAAAQARTSARFALDRLEATAYVRHAADALPVRAVLAEALGEAAAEQLVFVQADICRRELLVEIEAQAIAPGRLT